MILASHGCEAQEGVERSPATASELGNAQLNAVYHLPNVGETCHKYASDEALKGTGESERQRGVYGPPLEGDEMPKGVSVVEGTPWGYCHVQKILISLDRDSIRMKMCMRIDLGRALHLVQSYVVTRNRYSHHIYGVQKDQNPYKEHNLPPKGRREDGELSVGPAVHEVCGL